MASEGIYRDAAVARLSTPERLDQGLGIVGRPTWVILAALGALVVGGVIWSALLEVPVTVRGRGILLAPGGVLDVTSESPGRIVSFNVAVGDHVTIGSVVARLDQPDVRQEVVNAKAELRDAEEENSDILEIQRRRAPIFTASIEQRRHGFEETIALVDRRLKSLNERESANTFLAQKQLIAAQKLLDTQAEIARAQEEKVQAENGIRNLDVEMSKEQIENERERLNSELKVSAAQRKIRTVREKLDRQSVVVSPYDGVVGEIKLSPGEIVERGRPLFSLLPPNTATTDASETGPLFAVIYVPPSDGKKVHPGMKVRVAPSTVHREEYGFVQGRVRTVAGIPATVEGMDHTLKNRQMVQDLVKEGAPFEVLVDLLADRNAPSGYRWSSSHGPATGIDAGTLTAAEVETESVPLLSLMVPALRKILGAQR